MLCQLLHCARFLAASRLAVDLMMMRQGVEGKCVHWFSCTCPQSLPPWLTQIFDSRGWFEAAFVVAACFAEHSDHAGSFKRGWDLLFAIFLVFSMTEGTQ
jgi:hypothetical protein